METALDSECPDCHGEGTVTPDYYSPPRCVMCMKCDGHGRIPTEFGEEVLRFVSERLKLSATVST